MKQIKYIIAICLLTSLSCKLKLFSDDIKNNEKINKDFSPYGKDINPGFYWENVPKETKSLVFSVEDPDAPRGIWYHWILINISPEITKLEKNSIIGKEIMNSWRITRYKGPRPPKGVHHYHFVLYALDINKLDCDSYRNFKKSIKNHIIEKDEIIGLFGEDPNKYEKSNL